MLSAGSYPFAETYSYQIAEDSLIYILTSFKEKYPYLIPPYKLGLVDGKTDSTDFWYHVYFYNRSKQEVLHTWVRAKNKNITNFSFVGVNEGSKLGNWKEINHDYNSAEMLSKRKSSRN